MTLDQNTAPPQPALRCDIPPDTTAAARSSVRTTITPALRTPGLLVFEGSALSAVVTLDGERVTVGRDPDCSITVNDKSVSRLHCSVMLRDGEVLLTDAGSTNGTYRFGKRLDSVLLAEGDEITIGLVLIKVVDLARESWTTPRDAFARLYLDPQSGLLNRRGFRLRIDACCSVLPPGTELGLMMLGVRSFARNGENSGTGISADLAAQLGRALADCVPITAYAARIGPEQFAVVVFGVDPAGQRALAERVLDRFDRGRPHETRVRLALDLGVASGRITPDGPRSLFCLADDALDRARADGSGGLVQLLGR